MRGESEEIVETLWTEALGEAVGARNVDFFETGGNSLLATEIVVRCRTIFGVNIPLDTLFEFSTIAEFTARIEELQRGSLPAAEAPLKRVSRSAPLPLSFPQQRLWIAQSLNPKSPFFNVPLGLRFKGAIQVSIVQRALQQIMDRHEILRTSFQEDDGAVTQSARDHAELKLTARSLESRPGESREEALRRSAQDECGKPFDLTGEVPIRALLLRADEDDHLLVIITHHIATDGSSGNVIIAELCRLYEAMSEDRPAELPELPVQYADYAVWQREVLQGEKLQGLLSYWRNQLAGASDLLRLPVDVERPAEPTFSGQHLSLSLPKDLVEALKSICHREGCTLFMLLCATFMLLMSRYSAQDDLIVGTDVANRTAMDLKNLIGFFVNVLPLRMNLTGDPTFSDLLCRVRDTALGAYAHQELPFDKIVEDISPGRSAGHHPLVQAIFVMQNRERPSLQVPGLEVELFPIPLRHSRFDLGVFAQEDPNGVLLDWRYSDEIFNVRKIDKMKEEFLRLLQDVAVSPDRNISALQHLSAEDQQLYQQDKERALELRGRKIKIARRRAGQ